MANACSLTNSANFWKVPVFVIGSSFPSVHSTELLLKKAEQIPNLQDICKSLF